MRHDNSTIMLLRRSLWPLLLLFLPSLLYAMQNYVDALSTIESSDTQTWSIFHAQLLHMLNPANILQQWGKMFLLHWKISPVLGAGMLLALFLALRLWYRNSSFATGVLLLFVACLYQEPGYILLCIIHLYIFS